MNIDLNEGTMLDHWTTSYRGGIDVLEVGYSALSEAFRGRDDVGCIT